MKVTYQVDSKMWRLDENGVIHFKTRSVIEAHNHAESVSLLQVLLNCITIMNQIFSDQDEPFQSSKEADWERPGQK